MKNLNQTLFILILLASANTVLAQSNPTCSSSKVDPDGDGWGWENGASCKVSQAQSSAPCVDADGDGWGWNGYESCRMDAPANTTVDNNTETESGTCVDTDGDGWGWDGTSTCTMGSPSTPPATDTVAPNNTDEDAEPVVTTACEASNQIMEAAALKLLNELRASQQKCGNTFSPATSKLTANRTLTLTAKGHSSNMSAQKFFSHKDHNGQFVSDRSTTAGYRWSTIGENIVAGYESLEEAVQGWSESFSHCQNIMKENYDNFGIGCAVQNNNSDRQTYWTLVLGSEQ